MLYDLSSFFRKILFHFRFFLDIFYFIIIGSLRTSFAIGLIRISGIYFASLIIGIMECWNRGMMGFHYFIVPCGEQSRWPQKCDNSLGCRNSDSL